MSRWIPFCSLSTLHYNVKVDTILFTVHLALQCQGGYHSVHCPPCTTMSRRIPFCSLSTLHYNVKADTILFTVHLALQCQGGYHSVHCPPCTTMSRRIPFCSLSTLHYNVKADTILFTVHLALQCQGGYHSVHSSTCPFFLSTSCLNLYLDKFSFSSSHTFPCTMQPPALTCTWTSLASHQVTLFLALCNLLP